VQGWWIGRPSAAIAVVGSSWASVAGSLGVSTPAAVAATPRAVADASAAGVPATDTLHNGTADASGAVTEDAALTQPLRPQERRSDCIALGVDGAYALPNGTFRT